MRRPRAEFNTDSGSVLSKNSWLIIILAVLFLIYVFVPPVRNSMNSVLGTVFSPIMEMLSLSAESLQYI